MKLVGENEVKIQIESSVGPMGPAGPRGPRGEQGPRGLTGATGPKGAKGDRGETGAPFTYDMFTGEQLAALQGPAGPQGPKGDKGDKGEDGVQIDDAAPGATTVYSSEKGEAGLNALNEAIVSVQSVWDKPKIFITGSIPTTEDNVLAELWYESQPLVFHAYIEIQCQGSSSMKWDKKNFTVTLYRDEARSIPLNVIFPGWKNAGNRFTLKANYIDHTHLRNIVGARLWSEVVASRPDYAALPAQLRSSPNHGAADGFPVFVYINGSYQGVYTWNIGKGAWMVGMDESNPSHNMLCNEKNTNTVDSASNFRALWDGSDTYYSYGVGEKSDTVKDSLNALIGFVMNNEGDAFRAGIGEYLDVQSGIDYWLHQYVIVGIDGLGKNMQLLCYDGKKRYLSAYDMDATWLLMWDGNSLLPATQPCPGAYQETRNLLFERLNDAYPAEIKQRYIALRRSVYTQSNIMTHMERFYASIGEAAYADDLKVYPGIPSAEANNIWQLRAAVRDRLAYCDHMLLGGDVDYIESDGASFIDTGIIPDNDMLIDISVLNPENEMNGEGYFGAAQSSMEMRRVGTAPSNYVTFRVAGKDYTSNFLGSGYHAPGYRRNWSFDTSVSEAFTANSTVLIFAYRDGGTLLPVAMSTIQLYSFKIARKSTSEVLIDLVPSVDAGGVACLYDKAHNKRYYNGGTGKLTAHASA